MSTKQIQLMRALLPYLESLDRFDFDYRPPGYWNQPVKAIGSQVRSQVARAAGLPALSDLSPHTQKLLEATHPRFMGGAYLPGFRGQQTEIARCVMESVLHDVTSIRASEGVRIRYRVVDEYSQQYTCRPASSQLALTFAELVLLILSIRLANEGYGIFWFRNRPAARNREWEEYRTFLTFESHFYPQLEEFFQLEANAWAACRWPKHDLPRLTRVTRG
ncbi:MAG TPA: hypothetical protein VM328_02300 [Fimbriimonadaceae bacterium]|nr:hypothetical protein [Fimbriimonadaceae bacterium]